MNIIHRMNYLQAFSYLIAAVMLFGAGWYMHGSYDRRPEAHKERRVALQGFHFTSPLLDVELPEGVVIGDDPMPFKYKIKAFVQRKIAAGPVSDVAVYYRDLHDGPWFGINQNTEFNPASMMKVPVMIAWLKRAERDPAVLMRTFVHDGKKDLSAGQDIPPAQTITPGRRYTVEELLRYMINYSDNNATSLLYEGLSTEELNAVMDSMDVNNNPNDDGNSLTVHGYSGFFRILYNASYLTREMSEKALGLLSLQDFPEGIAAGVPPGTPVAAKFGETAQGRQRGVKQLHEFGIVYHPSRPYILGIMTEGHDFARQKEVIRDISRMIYTEVDSVAAKKAGGR